MTDRDKVNQAAIPRSGDADDLSRKNSAQCELHVGGMDCASCADDIRRALEKLKGVQDVRVDVVGGKVQVTYSEDKLARADIWGAIRRICCAVLP